ncbi:MAG: ABC transporter ATP-binding protein [Rhodospirillaceae bacterium]|jgi:branched-chain amino acid transport system ATP-binding protein|nr:ABC transporter ATP-binding protein [Rhodospirillaceae bacterium]MBT5457808.1 ABC transporter ATP-binding protein [Rhodospirillaceae bacterium]
MLRVDGIDTAYGTSQVLFGMSLTVEAGEVVTLMGRNGMGKTTTIRSIMGLLSPKEGVISFEGRTITGLPPYRIAKFGIGLVPEGRQIFPNLTVRENLIATAHNDLGATEPWTLERVLDRFPSLVARIDGMGNELSGGEQQMLAIGRALMTNPRLLILDEATEGLAPQIRTEIWRCLSDLKKQGQAILVIDKNVAALTQIADRHYMIEKGQVVWSGSSSELKAQPDIQHQYLGV